MYYRFNGPGDKNYILAEETLDNAVALIARAIKDGLPEEARRVDVLCFLLDKTKSWVESQRLAL